MPLVKPYFRKIDPVHEQLWSFKCTMFLNLNFLESENILNISFIGQELKLASPQYHLDLI